ncbi:phosphoribosylanthranilate isomerase [Sphingomonas lacunae]|uniref:N-(5'-phosphoribosyl)anthranilate isomerase n=1 Tax=Sphingomonas lacunae TaxID=2698828 RepID=A0A6M4AUQ5_9SPHN|nr:phosphoribosylanthranilate isomerase [Sphingomonas lacunae]QJQ32845.1 phosphoribosylanthranilate isomerase [Sphingomonas lacunae]
MKRVQTKICGISTPETLAAALAHGASHIGFVHFAKSPRHIDTGLARALGGRCPAHVRRVLLLVNPHPADAARLADEAGADILQLHGDEAPAQLSAIKALTGLELWKAVPVRTSADLNATAQWRGVADRLLYDAKPPAGSDLPGGNGLRFDWMLLQGHRHALPWALSGGLDPANVAEAIGTTGATLVDVSSGVESSPGIKDVDKIAAFLKAASS